MKLFLLLLLCLVIFKIVKPSERLHDFDSRTTLPLRGILALFIILHHLSQRYDFSISDSLTWPWQSLSLNIFITMGAPIVGVFFFLTGYGLSKSLNTKGKSYTTGFISKRFSKTLPEFMFLSILVSIYFIYTGYKSPNEFILSMSHGWVPLPFSWFIYAIFYVYVTFYISAIVFKAEIHKTGYLLTGFIFIYIFIIWRVLHWGSWWYNSALSVPLGYFIAIYEKQIDKLLLNQKYLSILLMLFFTLLGFGILYYKVSSLIQIYELILLTYLVIKLYGFPKWETLLWLGDISLNIYLIHGIILLTTKKFIINPYLALLTVIFISSITAYGLKKVRESYEKLLSIHKKKIGKICPKE